ncbi:papain family cysteine protease (macronuclear) [Tetrahymena thermophila SB210]|uniref:Papain family cysteine protease n=1 Tax=Tetrahymena thermophila (strain SB210) TaxID=312017 RepID=Q22LI1_TETTS|nr:papain family cysteine protease [Tetrahymena thermophila SB210]EAR86159.2 papain family cysteine protease [Tetrahymena thermophila SB210]|eukprot:XP_976754.2 papain family cysteine protease [Tetrahymena thermophila SB210]
MSNIIKVFDIFSMPFAFNLKEKEYKRKTLVGGIISLVIISISAIYFGYLCYLYFNNYINPTINETYQTIDYDFSMPISNNQMAFQIFMSNGQTLDQYQQTAGVTYAIPLVNYVFPDFNNNSQLKQTPLNIIKCSDVSLNGFYCFDFTPISNNQNQMNIGFDKNQIGNYRFEISIALCNTQQFISTYNCANTAQIQSDFLKITNKLTLKLTTQKYNTQTQLYQQFTKKEQISIQDTLTNILKINFLKTNSTIQQGFITQNNQYQNYISDYNKENLYFTQSAVQQQNKNNLNLVSIIQIQIGSYELKQNIQYPQFTYILAQFMSAFNVILVLGIIAQISAQSEIIQDFAEIQFKFNFKHNAWKYLISKNEGKIQDASLSQNLTKLHFQIQNLSFRQYLDKYLNLSFFKRTKLLLMNKLFDKGVTKNPQEKVFQKLIEQASQQFSIVDLQKELMQMKIILKLLLSPEQYAAIQLCGYLFKNENQDFNHDQSNQRLTNNEKQNQCNHLKQDIKQQQQQQDKIVKELLSQEDIKNELVKLKAIQQPQVQFENKEKQDQKSLSKQENGFISNQIIQEDILNERKEINQIESNKLSLKLQDKVYKNSIIYKQKQESQITDDYNINIDDNKIEQRSESRIDNHLEIIEQINNNMEQFQIFIEKFLDQRNTKSEIDKRILSCMAGIHNQIINKHQLF